MFKIVGPGASPGRLSTGYKERFCGRPAPQTTAPSSCFS